MLISDNIRIKSSGLGIQRSLKRIPPHTDPGRNVSLLYNIKGPAVTDFYEIDNFIPNIEYNPQDLKLKASVEMKLHKWYLFNNASIHGVKNIPDFERVAFVIHFHGIFKNFEEASANLKNLTYDR
ncbi:MAG: hypothetical protein EBV10_02685 [Synechococcaceae bacterium WB6_1A_059]|nr:hypothetical protein [Synechococcaceae bacterium WB6_1A_059]